ncbi:DUF3365 domain-containing protein [uncultured Pseudoteredinibacter sp.]|uniref:Tll0287-like domain-containing protein n=1 Tax=uncultured Pseudoteredinibacter sp. TaxID=1641701 RepID=UPI00262C2B5D|nr:DUF3365 domain-containing protein [uncultured Pseudoteredinibacter sp.]
MIRQILLCSLLTSQAFNGFASGLTPKSTVITPQQLKQAIVFNQTISKTLAGRLKERLISAVKSGGLEAGISQCNIAAPEISEQLKAEHPHTLISASRTSLKVRNENNQATTWQAEQLRAFDQLQSKGLKAGFRYRVLESNGKVAIEFMSPIPTQGLCLNCHGSQLNSSLSAKLNELYPNDKATAYSLGDIRGAFVIRSWLQEQ